MKKITREPTRAEIFLDVFEYWRKEYKMPPIETRKDLRYDCHACIEKWNKADDTHEKGYVELVYNTRRLAKWSYALLICGALHELGHYIHDLKYETFEQKIHSEYKAETFALRIMKKHYPTEYKKNVEYVITHNIYRKKWIKDNPIHYQAYMKIKDYTG